MLFDIEAKQREAIIDVLTFNSSESKSSTGKKDFWKVLIYDTFCQNVISPLIKVGSLRQNGVTLNINIDSSRSHVPDVPVTYLLEPTKENIYKILDDLKKSLYCDYYINFSTPISSNLLKEFALATASIQCNNKICQIHDRFVQFISLSSNEFSLDLPDSFSTFHSVVSEEQDIEYCISRIIDGLFSVITTLGTVPIIRCPSSPSSPAYTVGHRLNEFFKNFLTNNLTMTSKLYDRNSRSGISRNIERPVLILFDRETDFNVMLHHTWSYQALIHDIFGLRLNRVLLQDSSGNANKSKIYDLDSSDNIWVECCNKAFPDAALYISDSFQDYNKKAQIDQIMSDDISDSNVKITLNTLNAIPEMMMKKKYLDIHTSIAHSIVSEITERGLDKLYEIEDSFETGSLASSFTAIDKILSCDEKGTPVDKFRTLLCFYLAKNNQILPSQAAVLKEKITALYGNSNPLQFLDYTQSLKTFEKTPLNIQSEFVQNQTALVSSTTQWTSNIIDKSKGILQGVKNLLPLKKLLPITNVTTELIHNKPNSKINQDYLYFDPKMAVQFKLNDSNVPKVKSPFKQSIVFVVGGGSYVESHSLRDLAQKLDKQIIYGSTDFVRPNIFLEQLDSLGSVLSK